MQGATIKIVRLSLGPITNLIIVIIIIIIIIIQDHIMCLLICLYCTAEMSVAGHEISNVEVQMHTNQNS
jgi:hypothetical protein